MDNDMIMAWATKSNDIKRILGYDINAVI